MTGTCQLGKSLEVAHGSIATWVTYEDPYVGVDIFSTGLDLPSADIDASYSIHNLPKNG